MHPSNHCDVNAIAALYPQSAEDNNAEATVRVEVLIDREGHYSHPRARNDPGFGLAAAAERAAITACRSTVIPRDAAGNAVATRYIIPIGFVFAD